MALNREYPDLVRPVLIELTILEPRDFGYNSFGDPRIDDNAVHIVLGAKGTLRYMETGDIADYWRAE